MRVFTVLLVEDDAGDVELTREGLLAGKMAIDLQAVSDGEDALAYLRKAHPYTAAIRPDLVLLDLNMPRMGGIDVLRQMKGDADLRSIPVVVLTTSDDENDIATCYALGANSYITKPVEFDKFVKIVSVIEEFWFTIVTLPEEP